MPQQSASIYGHRAEYLPAQAAGPASMHGRYQPAFARVQARELPDRTDLPDGRFWVSGVAQGSVRDLYRRGAAGTGRRKPITAGPRTISAVIDGESHTLGNAFVDAAWARCGERVAGTGMGLPVCRRGGRRQLWWLLPWRGPSFAVACRFPVGFCSHETPTPITNLHPLPSFFHYKTSHQWPGNGGGGVQPGAPDLQPRQPTGADQRRVWRDGGAGHGA